MIFLRTVTPDMEAAAVKIQAAFKGIFRDVKGISNYQNFSKNAVSFGVAHLPDFPNHFI